MKRSPRRDRRPRTADRRTAARLLAWFDREKRPLPWRGTRDPYRIWVSEVMLQQTTVGAVRGRYEAFLARFPTLGTLARARESSVLAAWSGLGYYARARNLHRAARTIVREHAGRVPSDPAVLRGLPGFGEYIAAAIACLAYGQRVPAAEANVTRVLSRLFAIGAVAGTGRHRAAVRERAAELVAGLRPGDVTAALMDLGQLVCKPRLPDCPACPLSSGCAAFRAGRPGRYPRRRERPVTQRVHVAAAVAAEDGRALLLRPREGLLKSLWQFPASEGSSVRDALAGLRRDAERLGLRLDARAQPAVTRHTIVHRRLEIRVYRAARLRTTASHTGESPERRWISSRQLRDAAIPTLTRKIAAAAGFLPASWRPSGVAARSGRSDGTRVMAS